MDDDERDGHSGADALRGPDSVEAEASEPRGSILTTRPVMAVLDLVRWELELFAGG